MQQIKERPIIFNSEMIKAILDGRKTQTRRAVKPRPILSRGNIYRFEPKKDIDINISYHPDLALKFCPYGQVGDRLWVRETWALKTGLQYDHHSMVHYKDGSEKLIYWQDGHRVAERYGLFLKPEKWRPSIYMSHWASRINLEITNIRVERVQDITIEDALAEGVEVWVKKHRPNSDPRSIYPTADFAKLWDSINAKPCPVYYRNDKGKKIISNYISYPWADICEIKQYRGKPWDIFGNPWVWVVEFKVL